MDVVVGLAGAFPRADFRGGEDLRDRVHDPVVDLCDVFVFGTGHSIAGAHGEGFDRGDLPFAGDPFICGLQIFETWTKPSLSFW